MLYEIKSYPDIFDGQIKCFKMILLAEERRCYRVLII